MKCTGCGSDIKEGLKFCPHCGQKTSANPAVLQETKQDIKQDIKQVDLLGIQNEETSRLEYQDDETILMAYDAKPETVKKESVEKQSGQPASIICPECGVPNTGSRKFCSVCGASLHQMKAGTGRTTENDKEIKKREHNNGGGRQATKPPKKKKKTGCFVILLFVILLVIGAAIVAGLQMTGKLDLFSKVEQVLSNGDEKKVALIDNYYVDNTETAAMERPRMLAGYLTDENQEPIKDVRVTIYKESEEEPFVSLTSEEDGYFGWKIRDAGQKYYMVLEKEGYLSLTVYPGLSEHAASTGLLDISMMKDGSEIVPVNLEVYRVGETVSACQSAKIVFRHGYNSTDGDSVLELQSDELGKAAGELPSGVYTAEVSAAGTAMAYVVVYAGKKAETVSVYCPESAYAEDWSAVLTWQNTGDQLDLDGCVMHEGESVSYLTALAPQDGNGSIYLADDKGETGCELVSLKTEKSGAYHYLVSDYESVKEGTMDAETLSKSGAKVWVYYKGVLAQTFDVQQEKGGVWAAFAIDADTLWPEEKMYTEKTDFDWFQDKDILTLNALNDGNTMSNEHSYGRMCASGDWLYFRNPNDGNKLYFMNKAGEQVTKITDEEVKDLHIIGDYIYYAQEGRVNNLVRIKNDGSERIQLTNEVFTGAGWYLSLESVIGSKAYYVYCRRGMDVQISSYDMDTGGISIIRNMMDGEAGKYLYPHFTGEWVYFMKSDGLYRCKMDGSEEQCIKQGADWFEFILQDGWFYYITGDRQKIGCIRADGTNDMILTQAFEAGTIQKLSVYGDKLYCINGAHLYQLSWDGKSHKMLSATDWYNIYDNQIYFYSPGANGTSISRSDMNGNDIRQIYAN